MNFEKLASLLLEATDVEAFIKPIVAYLERKLGKKLLRYGGASFIEDFKNSEGSGKGIWFFINGTTQAIRFDIKGGKIEFIDIWSGKTKDPDVRLETKAFNSLIKVAPIVLDQLKKPTVGTFEVPEELTEASIKLDGKTFAKKGEAVQHLRSTKGMTFKQAGEFIDKLEVVTGPSNDEPVVKQSKLAKEFDDEVEKRIDVKTIFKDLEALVRMVGSKKEGSGRALLICGTPGSGKTTFTEQILAEMGYEEGKTYDKVSGAATPRGLYEKLFINHDGLLLFDDCDDIFKDTTAVNILKAALDTGKKRKISWISSANFDTKGMNMDEIEAEYKSQDSSKMRKLPNSFEFTGKVIFISNISLSKMDSALKSRAFTIDLSFTPEDMLIRLEDLLPRLVPNATDEERIEAFKLFKEVVLAKVKTGSIKSIDTRSMIKAINIRVAGGEDWQRRVKLFALS